MPVLLCSQFVFICNKFPRNFNKTLIGTKNKGVRKISNSLIISDIYCLNFIFVSSPPDEYSNRAELHPELRMQKYCFIFKMQMFKELNSCFCLALFLQNTVGYDDVRFIDPCIHDRSRTSEIWYLYLLFR